MNLHIPLLLGALLLAPTVLAASTVDLAVKGLITPIACTPSLSSNNVDYGKLSAKDLKPTSDTYLPLTVLKLIVSCDAKTRLAIRALDNRLGSAPDGWDDDFGLGLINAGTQKVGGYQLKLLNPTADSNPGQAIRSFTGVDDWARDSIWLPSYYMSVGDGTTDQPTELQVLTADLRIAPAIVRADSLDLSNEVAIDGSATLEVKYL
jgi:hypothetical protein